MIEMFKEYPDVLTVSQVQAALHIGRSAAYKLINSGQLNSIKIGKTIRIPKCYLLEFVNNTCYTQPVAADKLQPT